MSLVKKQVFMRQEGRLALCHQATGVLDDRRNMCTVTYKRSVSCMPHLTPQGTKESWQAVASIPHRQDTTPAFSHFI